MSNGCDRIALIKSVGYICNIKHVCFAPALLYVITAVLHTIFSRPYLQTCSYVIIILSYIPGQEYDRAL